MWISPLIFALNSDFYRSSVRHITRCDYYLPALFLRNPDQFEQNTVSVSFLRGRAEHAGHAADAGDALHWSRAVLATGFQPRQGRRVAGPGSGSVVTGNDVT